MLTTSLPRKSPLGTLIIYHYKGRHHTFLPWPSELQATSMHIFRVGLRDTKIPCGMTLVVITTNLATLRAQSISYLEMDRLFMRDVRSTLQEEGISLHNTDNQPTVRPDTSSDHVTLVEQDMDA